LTNTKKKSLKIIYNVIIPLIIGVLLYVSFRSTSIKMFGWFYNFGFRELTNLIRVFFNPFKKCLPSWIYYSLPDALWVYSFTSIYLILWNNRINYWLIIPFFFGCLFEIAQSLKIVDGTYDPIDLIFSLIAFILSIFINQLIKTNEKKI
jgi:hypothetical protein